MWSGFAKQYQIEEKHPLNAPCVWKPTMLSQTRNQNIWASGTRGALTFPCVTLFLWLTRTQTACLFTSERWKRSLRGPCSSRNNNSQGDFDSGYQETTSQTTSRYSSVSFSPVSCFFLFFFRSPFRLPSPPPLHPPPYRQEHDWTDISG